MPIGWKELKKELEKRGWILQKNPKGKSRGKGSHMLFKHPNHFAMITLPKQKELKRGLLYSILKIAGINKRDIGL